MTALDNFRHDMDAIVLLVKKFLDQLIDAFFSKSFAAPAQILFLPTWQTSDSDSFSIISHLELASKARPLQEPFAADNRCL